MTGRLRAVLRDAAIDVPDRLRLLADLARPYEPLRGGTQRLEAEYRAGAWDYLDGDEELPRFGVVAAYCHRYARGGSVLEIGCGEGLLAQRLGTLGVARFVGLDVAPSAIDRARALCLPFATFAVGHAETFEPDTTFDVILFHEMLEYLAEPEAVVHRYERWLAPDGRFVVSQFVSPESARARHIWRRLHRTYDVHGHAQVAVTRRLRWTIEVLAPRR